MSSNTTKFCPELGLDPANFGVKKGGCYGRSEQRAGIVPDIGLSASFLREVREAWAALRFSFSPAKNREKGCFPLKA